MRGGALSDSRKRVLLTARHHAGESVASYVLEGVMDEVVGSGEWRRLGLEVVAVPFMDMDGVHEGDQGKNRRPHDHNRDYGDVSRYEEVRALRSAEWIWGDGRLVAALDLHCPGLKGGPHDHVAFIGPPPPAKCDEIERLSKVVASSCSGPVKHDPRFDLPFGKEWNTEALAATCASWARGLPGVRVAATLEIPFAEAGGVAVDCSSARWLGRDLARALASYLDKTEKVEER
jgi:hypothetical protein